VPTSVAIVKGKKGKDLDEVRKMMGELFALIALHPRSYRPKAASSSNQSHRRRKPLGERDSYRAVFMRPWWKKCKRPGRRSDHCPKPQPSD